MKEVAVYEFKMPVFLITGIEYGDTTGYTKDDERALDRINKFAVGTVLKYNGHSGVWNFGDEEYFTSNPDFIREGSTVVDATFTVLK